VPQKKNAKYSQIIQVNAFEGENIRTNERFGIKLPKAELEEIFFLFKKGLVTEYGVVGSNRHVTLIDEKGISISSHLTDQTRSPQDKDRWKHLGRLYKSDMQEQMWLDQLKPRLIGNEELDKNLTYFTNSWNNIFNPLETDFLKKKITPKKTISYFDMDALIHPAQNLIQQLALHPNIFCGSCTAREVLARDEIVIGLLNNGRFIIKVDNELYEMDILSILNVGSPLFRIWENLGFVAIDGDITKRLEEISSKQKSPTEK